MPIKINDGSLRNIKRVRINDGTERIVKRIRINDGAVRVVFSFFSASLNKSNVAGFYNGSSSAPQDITTGAVSVIVSGGTPPYSYAWSVADTIYTWVANAPTSGTTTFTASGVEIYAVDETTFFCTVTDSDGIVAVTGVGTATVSNFSTAVPP